MQENMLDVIAMPQNFPRAMTCPQVKPMRHPAFIPRLLMRDMLQSQERFEKNHAQIRGNALQCQLFALPDLPSHASGVGVK